MPATSTSTSTSQLTTPALSLSPGEIISKYTDGCHAKTSRPLARAMILSVLAGMLIAFGGAAASIASLGAGNEFAGKVASGLLFPFGLGMVMLLGADLFTGNCLMPAALMRKSISLHGMLRGWLVAYAGNFIGALIVAGGCTASGMLDMNDGGMALAAIKTAALKCHVGFGAGFIKGIFCNVLVCAGVLCSLSARDTAGKILGAYIPVAFFVILGFEHSVANMYYIPMGLFAMMSPRFADAARQAGINIADLTGVGMVIGNLLPVTLGNIAGGTMLGMGMSFAHHRHRS